MRNSRRQAAFSFWSSHLGLQDCGCPLDLLFEQGHEHISNSRMQAGLPINIPGRMRYQAPPAAGTTCAVLILAAFQAFLCRARYSQQQLVLDVQPSHLLMPAASMVLKPPGLKHLPLVPVACPVVSRCDTLLSHAHKLHRLLLELAPYGLTGLPYICTAAGIAPAAGATPQQALFRAGVVYAADAAAGRAAAAGLDVALLLLPGPKPGSRHVLQALLLTNQGLFSQEGAGMMARHFEITCTLALRVSAATAVVSHRTKEQRQAC
ncbi:hypothetical protein COO60DRAFT_1458005 [Scenedesmus sp. NREL 46B-D3]|nr:hypothetical protein COO60DRAFT_1458005 [Scenedesmus sp. NREL 46B-D3]